MRQFILETMLLSLVGRVAAIITVYGLTVMVAKTFNLPYKLDNRTTALSLNAALLVGVGAGFLPALGANRLNPVKALHNI